jgi:chromate transporter
MNKLREMFWCFFKIGAFTLGGGYAMIPLIEKEVVENKKWLNKEEFMDVMVVSQSFPGALAVNCATFLGYKIGGLIGALVALLSVILPSFAIILVIASYFMQFRSNYYVNAIFLGITAIIPLLVLSGAISLSKGVERNRRNITIGLTALVLLVVFDINPSLLIVLGAIYGIVFLREKV